MTQYFKNKVTIPTLAAYTGYSNMCVSMALRDQAGIAEDTREKITLSAFPVFSTSLHFFVVPLLLLVLQRCGFSDEDSSSKA